MKVCVASGIQARSIQRISAALARHAPVEVVANRHAADLIVHLVVGVGNFDATPIDRLIAQEVANGQRYAIVQCCLMSTEEKQPDFWQPLWEGAEAVWSYLDLRAFAPTYVFNFHYAPLGIDKAFNRSRIVERDIDLLTTGYVADSECIDLAAEAVGRAGGTHVHVGPDFRFGAHSSSVSDVTDEHMATLYSRSRWVAGLRRDEGFELPAAEGLACGARPLMLDAPHYRRWFGAHADYVPESSSAVIVQSMERVLQGRPMVAADESEWALKFFNWERVVTSFWRAMPMFVKEAVA